MRLANRLSFAAWLLAGALPLALPARAAEALEIAAPDNRAFAPAVLSVLQQAYGKLGVTVTMRTVPLRRGMPMASMGELDGDMAHTAASLKEWPDLVVVKVPVARAVFSAYLRAPTCPAQVSRAELGASRVAYMRGTRAVEEVLPAAALRETTNNLDALRHVQRGFTSYAVVGQMEADALIIRNAMLDLCKVPEPVVVTELYHSLNPRHAQLAARVERVLQEMAEQGELKRIWTQETQRSQKALLDAP
ncbi:substrate-binding periplasmic protein [Burkholderiaceae bacterium UC74_6]